MSERHRKIKIKKFNFIFFPFCVKLRSAERKTDKLKNTGLIVRESMLFCISHLNLKIILSKFVSIQKLRNLTISKLKNEHGKTNNLHR